MPERHKVAYYRVPLPLVLLAGSIAGLIWFFVFPFLVALTLGYLVLRKMLAAVAWALRRVLERFATAHGHHQGWHSYRHIRRAKPEAGHFNPGGA